MLFLKDCNSVIKVVIFFLFNFFSYDFSRVKGFKFDLIVIILQLQFFNPRFVLRNSDDNRPRLLSLAEINRLISLYLVLLRRLPIEALSARAVEVGRPPYLLLDDLVRVGLGCLAHRYVVVHRVVGLCRDKGGQRVEIRAGMKRGIATLQLFINLKT